MANKQLTNREREIILKAYKDGGIALAEDESGKKYQLFCQNVTTDELKEYFDLDENNQLIVKKETLLEMI